MKVPLSWIREYVDLVLPVPQLVERLTLAGLEVGGVQMVGLPVPDGLRVKEEDAGPPWDRDKIVIAKVLEVRRHPDADRLTLVTLDYGKEPKTVVTGAQNIKVGDQGQKVILALTGSVLFDGHAEGRVLKQLKPTKIRGVPSDSMVCSAKELGLADEHEGIILLEADAPVGMPLADFMGDVVLEIDVLPNMARCLSMIGVAREIAALTDQKLKLPAAKLVATGESIENQVRVAIADANLSARYSAILIRNVTIQASPGWMRRRLQLAGMRPINNVVDVTNYVMLEWGQPLHAFDFDKLLARAKGQAPTIHVRPAKAGEKLTTLDNVQRELTPEQLLIADDAGPIALAGVMGGAETEVSAATKNVLLESANFNPISVRRTARHFDLPSEASYRFSRGVHPETVRPAAERTAAFLHEVAGGTVSKGMVDEYPAPPKAEPISLQMREVKRFLGFDFPEAEAVRILKALEFDVTTQAPGVLKVIPPPHRLDIQQGQADLIEELARIHGYDTLPSTLLEDQLPKQVDNRDLQNEERMRDVLVQAGLQEVATYSLTTPEREAPLLGDKPDYVRLANPISSERVVMRRSVLASVLDIAAANLRHRDTVRLFELGYAYVPRPNEKLPDEPPHLAIVLTGKRSDQAWNQQATEQLDFFDLKGCVEFLMEQLHLPEVTYRPAKQRHLHPGQSAEILLQGKPVGHFGQLHPGLLEHFQLGRRTVWVAEFSLRPILTAIPGQYHVTPIGEYPPVRQDVALVVDEALPAEKVANEIRAGGGELLRAVELFDLYRGPNLEPGKKSLAYHLTYQAADKTLTDKEVAKVHGKIVSRLEKTLGAKLRHLTVLT